MDWSIEGAHGAYWSHHPGATSATLSCLKNPKWCDFHEYANEDFRFWFMGISSNFSVSNTFDFPALLCQCGVAEVVVNPRWPPRTSVGKQERATSPSASCCRRWGWSGFLCCVFGISGVGNIEFGFLGVSRCKWGVRQRVGWAWSPSVPPPPHTHSNPLWWSAAQKLILTQRVDLHHRYQRHDRRQYRQLSAYERHVSSAIWQVQLQLSPWSDPQGTYAEHYYRHEQLSLCDQRLLLIECDQNCWAWSHLAT